MGSLVRQCRQILISLNNCKVAWCHRNCNNVADALSKIGLSKSCNSFFELDLPREIQSLVIKDCRE